MLNGAGISGNFSSSQSALAIKRPGSSYEYYLFTMGLTSSTGFRYSIIDMSLASGTGSVVAKNLPLYIHLPSEKLAATKHCNGSDVWVMMHDSLNNFRCYLLSNTGVSANPVISSIGTSYYPSNIGATLGCMKFSPNGKKLAVILAQSSFTTPAKIELYDFDNSTGTLSNQQTIATLQTAYDCEFSPDGSKLYSGTTVLLQWDLCAGSTGAIASSVYTVAVTNVANSAFQRAINGKIYGSKTLQPYLSVINNPNLAGAACNYVDQGQSVFPNTCNMGLPNFVSNDIKSYLNYVQGLGCNSVTFSPPPIVYTGTAGCSNVVSLVTGYQWSFGDPASGAANTSTLSSPVHSYPGNGTYSVQLILTYNSCAPDTIKQNLVLSNPVIGVNSASMSCNGLATATISISQGYSNGQYSYTWNPGPLTGPVASNISPGVYTITANTIGGNCPITFTAHVSAPQNTLTATINTTLSCTTASAEVSVNGGSGNYTYIWSPGSSTNSAVLSVLPGNYTVTISDLINQCSHSQTVYVGTLPIPSLTITGDFTICPGNSAILTASGADTYSWSTNSLTAVINVTPNITTIYTVVGTNSVSQCTDTKTVMVKINNCQGLKEEDISKNIRIYPNPNSGILYLVTDSKAEVRIYNMLGEMRYCREFEGGEKMIDISSFINGVYFMSVKAGGKTPTYKVLKTD